MRVEELIVLDLQLKAEEVGKTYRSLFAEKYPKYINLNDSQ